MFEIQELPKKPRRRHPSDRYKPPPPEDANACTAEKRENCRSVQFTVNRNEDQSMCWLLGLLLPSSSNFAMSLVAVVVGVTLLRPASRLM